MPPSDMDQWENLIEQPENMTKSVLQVLEKVLSTVQLEQIQQQGYRAYQGGIPLERCSYPTNSKLSDKWYRGWRAAEEEFGSPNDTYNPKGKMAQRDLGYTDYVLSRKPSPPVARERIYGQRYAEEDFGPIPKIPRVTEEEEEYEGALLPDEELPVPRAIPRREEIRKAYRASLNAALLLKDYLRALKPEQKDALWLWLDANPDAIGELIECVGKKDGSANADFNPETGDFNDIKDH